MDHDNGGSQATSLPGQEDVDQLMTAFRAALARMDGDPSEAVRIRDLADLTDNRLSPDDRLAPEDRLASGGRSRRRAGVFAPSACAASSDLLDALGVQLNLGSLDHALTHRSYAYENGNLPTNERLEFLGDSVLGLVVTDTLFRRYPDLPEGQLAKLRAAVVQMSTLADVARDLNLGAYLRLGRGEEATGGRDKSSILADTLEAVIGEVYLELGLTAADALVHQLFDPVIERSGNLGAGLDWKTSLQELTALQMLGVPEYLVEESGPDHQKFFSAVVRVAGKTLGAGEGRSKKAAEQQAARAAWIAITEE